MEAAPQRPARLALDHPTKRRTVRGGERSYAGADAARAAAACIAENLGQAGVRPDDIFIFMHENDHSDWSVCGGRFAMALVQQRGVTG